MKKSLLIILIAVCAMPMTMLAESPMEANSQMSIQNEPQITVENGIIHVQNAQGKVVYVYSLTGAEVHKETIKSADQALDFAPQNNCKLYIVKVGNIARKVNLK